MNNIDFDEIQKIISHWLKCPENGYLGSGYGYRDSIIRYLQESPNDDIVQKTILKMRSDLKILEGENVSLTWVAGAKQITVTVNNNIATFPVEICD